jgi:hypothetical protein
MSMFEPETLILRMDDKFLRYLFGLDYQHVLNNDRKDLSSLGKKKQLRLLTQITTLMKGNVIGICYHFCSKALKHIGVVTLDFRFPFE